MSQTIEFFDKKIGEVIPNKDGWLFVMDDQVFSDNGKSFESQEFSVTFECFIVAHPDKDWRAKEVE